MRARLAAPVVQIVQEVNAFLRGWAGFFRYGNSAHAFDKIRTYAVLRVALLSPSAPAGPGMGFAQVYRSPDSLGLISLNGTVVAPRPNRPWRVRSNTRRWTSVSRVRENRMHGSTGRGWKRSSRHRASPSPNQPLCRERLSYCETEDSKRDRGCMSWLFDQHIVAVLDVTDERVVRSPLLPESRCVQARMTAGAHGDDWQERDPSARSSLLGW